MWIQNNLSNSRSGCIKYPLLDKTPKERDMNSTVMHMNKALESKNPVFGVKSPSQLINLINFDIIKGCVLEPMHCCSGVAKQVAIQLFGTKKKTGLFSKKIHEIDELISNIKAPNQIVRLTRNLSEKEFWKAREWENWTLYYSLSIFEIVLEKKFTVHWALFVDAIYLLLKDNIQVQEIDWADQLLHKFVSNSEILYYKVSMTFNMHLLLHLAKSVYFWGPLWAHNAFAFESGNGQLLKVIHASKGIHHQICRKVSLQYSYLMLKERIYPLCSSSVRHFLTFAGTTKVQKSIQMSDIRYFGTPSAVNILWLEILQMTLILQFLRSDDK